MRYVCHICGDTDSEGGCFSGKTGLFTCKRCMDKLILKGEK